jgi:hypothetical protein
MWQAAVATCFPGLSACSLASGSLRCSIGGSGDEVQVGAARHASNGSLGSVRGEVTGSSSSGVQRRGAVENRAGGRARLEQGSAWGVIWGKKSPDAWGRQRERRPTHGVVQARVAGIWAGGSHGAGLAR